MQCQDSPDSSILQSSLNKRCLTKQEGNLIDMKHLETSESLSVEYARSAAKESFASSTPAIGPSHISFCTTSEQGQRRFTTNGFYMFAVGQALPRDFDLA